VININKDGTKNLIYFDMHKVEIKRSWWYSVLRSIQFFCFRFWWAIWLFFILYLVLWLIFCCCSKPYACDLDNKIGDQVAEINRNIDSCCACSVITQPIVTNPITQPKETKPCDYNESKEGGKGVTTNFHSLGSTPGQVTITYQMQNLPDRIDVYYDDVLVASTNNYVKGGGTLSFYYPAENGKPTFCKIVLSAPNDGTAWSYKIGCPR
jgi:hypothetical protein